MQSKRIIVSIIGLVISLFTYQCDTSSDKDAEFDKALALAAETLNEDYPTDVDGTIRIDNVVALPGKKLVYNYTILTNSAEELPAGLVKQLFEPALIEDIKTFSELQQLRDNDVTFVYNYSGNDGVFITTITITPEMYKE